MPTSKDKLTLDRPVVYEIKVPAQLDQSWAEWNGHLTLKIETMVRRTNSFYPDGHIRPGRFAEPAAPDLRHGIALDFSHFCGLWLIDCKSCTDSCKRDQASDPYPQR